MGRAPGSRVTLEEGLNKGSWTEEEDAILTAFIRANGEGNWRTLPKLAGLQRCRKSCRLRWMNYLRPDLKRGNFSPDEDELIIKLHSLLGNRWSLIAGRISGRTDNEIKNYWNSRLKRKLKSMEAGDLSYIVEATPLSCSLLDNSSSEPASSSRSGINANPSPLETSFANCDADAFASSSRFPEYADFEATNPSRATSSEPSSDGTCFEDYCDHQSLDQGYYSPDWTPRDEIPGNNRLESSLHAYSPESALFQPEDFSSGGDGLTELEIDHDSREMANLQILLQCVPLSPLKKNIMTSLSWPWPGFYSGYGF